MHYYLWLVVLLGLPVQAASIDVTAEYKPAAYEVGRGKFINTTPCNGEPLLGFWCSGTSTVDESQPLFISITIDRVVNNNNKLADALTYLGFVGARDVSLVNQGSNKSYSMKFLFTKIGALMSPNIAREALLNNSDWLDYIDGDCQASLSSWANLYRVHYLYDIRYENQLAGGKCYHNKFKNTFSSDRTALSRIYLGYKLQAPDPLKMENGVYKGSLVLSIGRNKDLDFGNGTYSDNQLTINFTMSVRHQIKVEFPPGGGKVTLLPPGGWHDWIYGGKTKIPTELSAELPYRFWASSSFVIKLKCQYQIGVSCAIKNNKDHRVIVDVQYRNRLGMGKEHILSTNNYIVTVDDKGASIGEERKILFKVAEANVREMIKYPGSTYKGDVTIIYDASI